PRSYSAQGIHAAFDAGAGGVVTKTLCLEPAVNPAPHISRPRSRGLRNSLLNCEKWADLSWEQWVNVELPALKEHPGVLIVSIGHSSVDAETICPPVLATGTVDIIECVAYRWEDLPPLVRSVRQLTDLPILAKLSFNWGEALTFTAAAAFGAGASGFTAIDSIGPTLAIDIETGYPLLAGLNGNGWISGEALKPIALAVVADLVKHYEIPVVATGGVINGEDVIEMTMVGAQAVGVCTAPLLQGLSWFKKCEMQTERWLEKHQLTSLDEIRGLALRFLPFEDRKIQLEFHFDPKQCTLCGLCEKVCPYNAREVVPSDEEDGPVQLKWSKNDCRLCGLCAEVCKTGALSIENWPPNKGVFAP
ncbi:MAG: 4Fe-4S binding protein, partial [Anaerolineales bacterium]|nr:4Fe-4S binding protein [Anaerolineales bacterium]